MKCEGTQQMATLKDVAKETGLTVSTVSRVLNNRGYISEETRKKVYEAMKKLNYQPNEVARSLSRKATNTIGVIVPHIRHPYFAELISNLESQAYRHKHKILLFNSQEKNEKESEYLEMCKSNRVAGIILCSGTVQMQQLTGLNVPLITIERYLENGTAGVQCNNRQGGSLAARHLIEKNCRHLIHISGVHETVMPADERTAGFQEVCKQQGIECHTVATNAFQYNHLEYHEILEQVLREHPEADGIFASSDLIAAQLLQVCRKLDISVPEQIKIVGFDDVNIASLTTPPLTTIHQPVKEMAREAVELLIRAGNGEVVPSRTMLPVALAVRETT